MAYPLRRPYRLPASVRKALFDCRSFFKMLNKHSDDLNQRNGTLRTAEAQAHYAKAEELIRDINECLR